MVWIEPLDLEYLLVNTFAGSMNIFIFVAFLVFAGLAAYFRMISSVTLLLLALFGIIMANYFVGSGFYFIIILIAGLVIAWIITQMGKR